MDGVWLSVPPSRLVCCACQAHMQECALEVIVPSSVISFAKQSVRFVCWQMLRSKLLCHSAQETPDVSGSHASFKKDETELVRAASDNSAHLVEHYVHRSALSSCTKFVWSVCVKLVLTCSQGCLASSHRVALLNRTGLRVIVTQLFATLGFVPMIKFSSVVCINSRCDGQSRVISDHVIARSTQQGNGRHMVVEAFQSLFRMV